jgi:hypothetical protein
VHFDETLQRDYELIAGRFEALRTMLLNLRIMGYSRPFDDFMGAMRSTAACNALISPGTMPLSSDQVIVRRPGRAIGP